MPYRLAADAVLIGHVAFVLFVLLGGLMVLHRPKLAWAHVPAVLWGALVELTGWICPLTPLEVALRRAAGSAGYSGGFVDHYLTAALYPDGISRAIQATLGVAVVVLNAAIYAAVLQRHLRHRAYKGETARQELGNGIRDESPP